MKIKVKDLRPNPFRDLNICPIDYDKVGRLKLSIKELDFWDNLLARPAKDEEGKYELAYGYHRLEALRALEWEEIDIPVKNLTDENMIRIMGKENQEWYGKNTAVIIETIKVAKEFIENHIAEKNAVYEDLDKWCRELFENESNFKMSINKGTLGQNNQSVGRSVIERFLGKTWDTNTIKFALKVMGGETETKATDYDVTEHVEGEVLPKKITVPISQDAAEKFPVVGQSRKFVETITRDPDCRTAFPTEEAQRDVADVIIKRIKEDGRKVSSSTIGDYMKDEAKKVLGKSEEVGSQVPKEQKPYRDLNKEEKVPKLENSIKRLLDRIEELPSVEKQRVFTSVMFQGAINDLYEAEYLIQKFRKDMEERSNLCPDADCIFYDIYPSCTDFATEDALDLIEAVTSNEEVLDEDAVLNEYIENGGIYTEEDVANGNIVKERFMED